MCINVINVFHSLCSYLGVIMLIPVVLLFESMILRVKQVSPLEAQFAIGIISGIVHQTFFLFQDFLADLSIFFPAELKRDQSWARSKRMP